MSALVSVIIPFYGRGEALGRALRSVLGQTYRNLEIILVDDGSPDESMLPSVQDVLTGSGIRYRGVRQPNAGPGAARAFGLVHAQGEYIVYLDSDDELLSGMVESLLSRLLAEPDAVMCYCPYIYIRSDGRSKKLGSSPPLGTDLLELALNCRPWHTSACMWHYPNKSIAQWPHIYGGEDVAHDVSVGITQRKLVFVPEALVNVYAGEDGLTSLATLRRHHLRLAADLLTVRETCYRLLAGAGLVKQARYSLPFVERCFRGAVQLALMGETRKSLHCLWIAWQAAVRLRQFIEIIVAAALIILSFGKLPGLYHLIFKFHLKITPSSVHCDKKPNIV